MTDNNALKVGKLYILCGDRGVTYVGRLAWAGVDPLLQIPSLRFAPGGAVVRRWGTTAGIGQLVPSPTGETTLDYCNSPVTFACITLTSLMEIDEKGWGEKVKETPWPLEG